VTVDWGEEDSSHLQGDVSGMGPGLNNSRASVLTVQALLGHKHVDTTLRYARLYDSTLAADYVCAACKKAADLVPQMPKAL
jgi:integrase